MSIVQGCVRFVISMFCKALFEETVSKDAGLWQSIDSKFDAHVDISILGLGSEVILIDDMFRDKLEWHFHVLKAVERSIKIKVLDIDSHELGIFGTNHAVPKYL